MIFGTNISYPMKKRKKKENKDKKKLLNIFLTLRTVLTFTNKHKLPI
jgi:hypothetical protein